MPGCFPQEERISKSRQDAWCSSLLLLLGLRWKLPKGSARIPSLRDQTGLVKRTPFLLRWKENPHGTVWILAPGQRTEFGSYLPQNRLHPIETRCCLSSFGSGRWGYPQPELWFPLLHWQTQPQRILEFLGSTACDRTEECL